MKLTCDHQAWEHELFDGQCPPPLPPRECCGAPALSPVHDVRRPCSNGQCTEWFCTCGVFMQMSAGPVFCGCDDLPGWGRIHPEQRPKRPVPAGPRHHRRYRNRMGSRR